MANFEAFRWKVSSSKNSEIGRGAYYTQIAIAYFLGGLIESGRIVRSGSRLF